MKRTVFVVVAVLLSTAFAKVWYVHPDSTQDSIQPCLSACSAGDTVLVAAGTYHERLIWPNIQGIKLLSETGAASTVIDGDSSGTVVTVLVNVDTTTVIDGFTVTGGRSNSDAGGMKVVTGGPMIRNNTLTDNRGLYGGAIRASNTDAIYIVNNSFIGNHATSWGGAVFVQGGAAFITDNLFERNLSDTGVGAMYLGGTSGRVQGNALIGNRAPWWGALCCMDTVTADIVGNAFSYDTAEFGAGAMGFIRMDTSSHVDSNSIRHCKSGQVGAVECCDASPTFHEDTISDNESGTNGTVFCWVGSSPAFSRCIIAGNSQTFPSGAIKVADSSKAVIDSCSIKDNVGSGVYVIYGARATISNSNIHGNSEYGLWCENFEDSIDARYNWWGDSTGPHHSTNPGGLGDSVSDGVRFRPWLTAPGIADFSGRVPVRLPIQATIVRGVLVLGAVDSRQPTEYRADLLDAAGRRVLELRPGANDARSLAQGVYFVREAQAQAQAQSVRKVVVTR